MATEEGEGFRETEWETGCGQAERHTEEKESKGQRARQGEGEIGREVGRQAERELGHKETGERWERRMWAKTVGHMTGRNRKVMGQRTETEHIGG